jgi:hypothetical protein
VGAWGFDEASGTAARDRSGYGNDGTISGATRVTGKFGGALRFDGRNDYVTVPDAAQLDLRNAITIEAWVRPGRAGGVWRSIAIKEHGKNLDYGLYSNAGADGATGYLYTDHESKVASASELARDRWSHVAMTWDGSTMRLYVNGALVKSSPMKGALATSAGALRIGGNQVWGEFFEGTIDELRIYDRALPQAELQGDAARAVASLKVVSRGKHRAHPKKKRKGHRHASKHKRTKLRAHRLSAHADHYWHR